MPMKLTIVTARRTVLEREGVTKLVVPAAEGQITILPSHAALMSSLAIGEMMVHSPQGVEPLAIHGGFIQVVNDEISVLADAAERFDEIDLERAGEARQRAQQRLERRPGVDVEGALDVDRAQRALQRAALRERIGRRRSGFAEARA